MHYYNIKDKWSYSEIATILLSVKLQYTISLSILHLTAESRHQIDKSYLFCYQQDITFSATLSTCFTC